MTIDFHRSSPLEREVFQMRLASVRTIGFVSGQAAPKRSLLSYSASEGPARPPLANSCNRSALSAPYQVAQIGIYSKSSNSAQFQLRRQGPKQRQRHCHATHCQASDSGQAATDSGFTGVIKQFLLDQFLPVGLLLAMLVGWVAASALCTLQICLLHHAGVRLKMYMHVKSYRSRLHTHTTH